MSRNNTVTGFCVFVFLAGSGMAQAATANRRSQQQYDKQFLRTIAIADMTETHAAEMAQSTAKGAPVKDFGQTVAKDETQEYVQLTMLAHQSGRAVVYTGPKEVAELKADQIRTFHEMRERDGKNLGPLGCDIEPAPGA